MNVLDATELYTKNDSSGKFNVVYILPHTKELKLKKKKERERVTLELSYLRYKGVNQPKPGEEVAGNLMLAVNPFFIKGINSHFWLGTTLRGSEIE